VKIKRHSIINKKITLSQKMENTTLPPTNDNRIPGRFSSFIAGKSINQLLEIISAIILSLATVASAWSAYQSASWNSVERSLARQATNTSTESIRKSTTAMQYTVIDVSMFLEYAHAYSLGNDLLSDFLYQRFTPQLKTAVDAWVALKPLSNENAPSTPFTMPEYLSPLKIESEELLLISEEKLVEAGKASENSDNYALFTVIFASVLFFAGIISKFESVKIQIILLVFAALTFLGGVIVIMTSPIS